MLTAKLNTPDVDALIKKLAFYRVGAKQRVDEVLATGALLIESDAKVLSPVDTGLNRASIAAVREDFMKWKVAVNTAYAATLEFGRAGRPAQPFLFPAYLLNKAAILAQVKLAIKYKQ